MAKYYTYPPIGDITKVVDELDFIEKGGLPVDKNITLFSRVDEIFEAVTNSDLFRGVIDRENLCISYYDFDDRINRPVYLLTTNRLGEEHFSCPQALTFVVEVNV